MGGWIDVLENPQAITSLFGDAVPSLRDVDLHEISLNRDVPSMVIRFDIDEFPRWRPAKWVRAGYNRVQIALTLDFLSRVSIVGWNRGCRVDLALRRNGDMRVCETSNGACKLEVEAELARVTNVSPYIDGAR